MDEHVLIQLESAAQIVLAPPSVVTSEQRQSAESTFMKLRGTPSPFKLCINILETSKVEYVRFEAAGVLASAFIQECTVMPAEDVVALGTFLIQHVTTNVFLTPLVRNKLVQGLATILCIIRMRRLTDDYGLALRTELLQRVCQLISSQNLHEKLVGCEIFSILVQDSAFAPVACFAVLYGSETRDLRRVWIERMTKALELLVSSLGTALNEAIPSQQLREKLLSLIVDVLSWQSKLNNSSFCVQHFSKTRLWNEGHSRSGESLASFAKSTKTCSSQDGAFPTPSGVWEEFLTVPDMVNFFFCEVFVKVHSDPGCSQHALTILVMLAHCCTSYNPYQPISSVMKEYHASAVRALNIVLGSVEIADRNALGFAQMIEALSKAESGFNDAVWKVFADILITNTCLVAEHAAEEENLKKEEKNYLEALDILLVTFVKLWNSSGISPECPPEEDDLRRSEEACKGLAVGAAKIFETYIMCHLGPPTGVRGQSRGTRAEEYFEFDEDDYDKFSEPLTSIGGIGSRVPATTLPLLSSLLETYTVQLQTELQRVGKGADGGSLKNLSEDIHWLLLITGYVFQDEYWLLEHSLKQSDSIDLPATLNLLTSPDKNFQGSPGQEACVDDAVRLLACVFRLCELERRAVEAKLGAALGSRIGCSLMWFLNKWLPFLQLWDMKEEPESAQISAALNEAFGTQSPVRHWINNFILTKIKLNLETRRDERYLFEVTMETLILALGQNLVGADRYNAYMLLVNNPSYTLLPRTVRNYYETLYNCLETEVNQQMYAKQVFAVTLAQCLGVAQHEHFPNNLLVGNNKTVFIYSLSALTGLVWGAGHHWQSREDNLSDIRDLFGDGKECGARNEEGGERGFINILSDLKPALSQLPPIFQTCGTSPDILEACLELLSATMTAPFRTVQRDFCSGERKYENAKNCRREFDEFLLQTCLHVINAWNQISLDQWDFSPLTIYDPTPVVKLFLNLLSDVCDFLKGAMKSDEINQVDALFVNSIVGGLLSVAPISGDIFPNSTVMELFWMTLSTLCRWQPEAVAHLPENVFAVFVSAIEAAVASYKRSLSVGDCLSALTEFLCLNPKEESLRKYLRPVFHTVFQEAILNKPEELSVTFVRAFRNCVACYQDEYDKEVEAVVSLPNVSIVNAEKLRKAFQDLFRTTVRDISRLGIQAVVSEGCDFVYLDAVRNCVRQVRELIIV